MHGMSLSHLQLGIAFRAAQNFPFFHFVFVEIDLGVAFRASRHGLSPPAANLNWRAYYITPVSSFLGPVSRFLRPA